MTETETDLQDLIQETERLCHRYIDEVVLRFRLCPWAEPSLRANLVQINVITDIFLSNGDFSGPADQVRRVLAQQIRPEIELALIVLPRAQFSRLEMDDLLRSVRASRRFGRGGQEEEEGRESVPAFALAAFHPDAEPNLMTPERLIPFLRRTPDPMIQAVRTEVIRRIDPGRGSGTAFFDPEKQSFASLTDAPTLSVRARIASANHEHVQAVGIEQVERAFLSIHEDHRETRRRLGL